MQPNISVITEDIYLKLRVVVHCQKGTHTSRGGNLPIFFTKLCPFLDLEFSKCSYSQALAPACVLLFYAFSLRRFQKVYRYVLERSFAKDSSWLLVKCVVIKSD